MRSVTVLSTAFLMIVSSMAGCIEGLEEITEIIGCSDENAENFNPNATTVSDDLCLFLENEATFIAALGDAMAADPTDYLLDSDSGVSGVQYGIELDGVDPDSGMSVSLEMFRWSWGIGSLSRCSIELCNNTRTRSASTRWWSGGAPVSW